MYVSESRACVWQRFFSEENVGNKGKKERKKEKRKREARKICRTQIRSEWRKEEKALSESAEEEREHEDARDRRNGSEQTYSIERASLAPRFSSLRLLARLIWIFLLLPAGIKRRVFRLEDHLCAVKRRETGSQRGGAARSKRGSQTRKLRGLSAIKYR